MRQVIEDPLENRTIVILNDDVSVDCRVDGNIRKSPFAKMRIRGVFARRRAAPLWITAALLAMAWTSDSRGSPEARPAQSDARAPAQHKISVPELDFRGPVGARDIERVRASGATAKSVRLAQAVPDDPDELQKALEQEHDRAELLARELTIHRHLEMLLTLHRARAEAARFRQQSESEHTELREHLQQERLRLKKAAESGAAELCKILSGDRPAQSEQAAGANDTIELRTSLQQQRDRADRLEQDLAAAKRDLARQTAVVTEATEQATQVKGRAENDAAELRTSLQQERERTTQLEKDLAAARRDVETQTALASKANEQASQAKRAENDAAGLTTSLQQERQRAAQLEKDLAAARRDVETQTALASKANEQASQARRAAEADAAGLTTSLQQERQRARTTGEGSRGGAARCRDADGAGIQGERGGQPAEAGGGSELRRTQAIAAEGA